MNSTVFANFCSGQVFMSTKALANVVMTNVIQSERKNTWIVCYISCREANVNSGSDGFLELAQWVQTATLTTLLG